MKTSFLETPLPTAAGWSIPTARDRGMVTLLPGELGAMGCIPGPAKRLSGHENILRVRRPEVADRIRRYEAASHQGFVSGVYAHQLAQGRARFRSEGDATRDISQASSRRPAPRICKNLISRRDSVLDQVFYELAGFRDAFQLVVMAGPGKSRTGAPVQQYCHRARVLVVERDLERRAALFIRRVQFVACRRAQVRNS